MHDVAIQTGHNKHPRGAEGRRGKRVTMQDGAVCTTYRDSGCVGYGMGERVGLKDGQAWLSKCLACIMLQHKHTHLHWLQPATPGLSILLQYACSRALAS